MSDEKLDRLNREAERIQKRENEASAELYALERRCRKIQTVLKHQSAQSAFPANSCDAETPPVSGVKWWGNAVNIMVKNNL